MKLLSVLLISMILSFSVSAKDTLNSVAIGDTLSLSTLQDQFDKSHTLSADTQWLVFAHDMDSSKVVKQAFEQQTTQSLNQAHVQYYADISGMPSLISRFIGIPKMKKAKYLIILDKEGEALKALPKEEDKATLLQLKDHKVVSLLITDDASLVKTTLFK